MTVLGIASSPEALYGVVADGGEDAAARIVSLHAAPFDPVGAPDMDAALRTLIAETGIARVALTLAVGDAWIARLPGQEHLHRASERLKAGRLFAEREGFSAGSSVRIVRAHDGTYHLAVAEGDRVDALARFVRRAGGELAFADHESYAWAAVMPAGAQALVVVAGEDVKLFLFGPTTVESGRFALDTSAPAAAADETALRKIARAIAGALLRAAQDGFVDVHRVAVVEEGAELRTELAQFVAVGVAVEPYAFGDVPNPAYARAAGVALRAAGSDARRLHVNFFETRSRWDDALVRARKIVAPADLALVGAGAVAAIAMFGWRIETLHALETQAVRFESRVVAARRDASVIDRELSGISSARAVVRRVDDARRSGPLVARDLARISRSVSDGLSATTLVADPAGWTLTGHAREFPQIARLMAAMTAAGYSPSLNGSEQQGDRVAYAVTFPRATAARR